VEAYPDTPEGYQFLTPHGSVYVNFYGEDLVTQSQAMGIIKQDSTMVFIVSVIHRNLRVQGGIYKLLDEVKWALRGYKPIPGSSKIWIINTGRVSQEKGNWTYEIWIGLLMPQVERQDPDYSLPIAHQLNFDNVSTPESVERLTIEENEAPDPADETVTFTHSPNGGSRTEPMPPHQEPEYE
jgi:hypothetical protein